MPSSQIDSSALNFRGFEPFDANFINCPNQYLDICIPHRSRGLVRSVGYLIYKTYSWIDCYGMPVETQFKISWDELVSVVGISRGSVSAVKEEGQKYNYIHIDPDTKHVSLKFDEQGAAYQKSEDTFNGLHAGPGHRTKLPKQFFEYFLPREPLKVVKPVATIFRFTIGFETNSGYRRTQHELSERFISKHANLALRHTTVGLKIARAKNYVVRTKPGGPSQPAIYAPSWCVDVISRLRSETTNLITRVQRGIHVKSSPKAALPVVQKGIHQSSKRGTPKFKKGDNLKKLSKQSFKDNNKVQFVVAPEFQEAFNLLVQVEFGGERFNERTALLLAQSRGLEQIRNQINWFPKRKMDRNPLGGLYSAIEQDWSPPVDVKERERNRDAMQKQREADEAVAAEVADTDQRKKDLRKNKKWKDAFARLCALSRDEQIKIRQAAKNQLSNALDRKKFEDDANFCLQHCLDEFCRQKGTIPISTPS